MKKRTNKHSKRGGSRGRGRPAMSGSVQIEPIHVSRLDLTKLAHALELVANVGRLYKTAPEHIKRMFNQVFFEKVLVRTSDDVAPQKTPLFEALLSPQTKQLAISSELLLTSCKRLLHYAKRLSNILLVHPVRFERTTTWFEAKDSNPLSYGCIF